MITYGIAYKVTDISRPDLDAFKVTVGYAASYPKRDPNGYIKRPEHFLFPKPTYNGFRLERFGASEVRGLLGGVSNRQRYMLSETYERAISDVITATVCEIVDGREVSCLDGIDIIILGPALPKLAGRLASLRLPRSVRVVWLCPMEFLSWIVQGVDERVVLPHYLEGPPVVEGWEEEPLVQGYRWESYFIQQLWMTYGESTVKWYEPTPHSWPSLRQVSVAIPKEIAAAAGHVQHHVKEPYKRNEKLRPIDAIKDGVNMELYQNPVATRGGDGWEIKWCV